MLEFFKGLERSFTERRNCPAVKNSDDLRVFTYRDLDVLSGKVYRVLKAAGIGREDVVLIHMPRKPEVFAAMLGVWKAGAAFIICEDTMASERVAYIKADSGCSLVLDGRMFRDMADGEPLKGRERVQPHDLAYMVYTSGSTGSPKGVMHEFGNLDRSIRGKRPGGEYFYNEDDVAALNSTLSFVASVDHPINIFYHGACLLLVATRVVKNPAALIKLYEDKGVTACFMTPSLYRSCGTFNSQMRKINLGGEVCAHISSDTIRLFNGYNMSEAGRDMCLFAIDLPYDVTPIGRNMGGEDIFLLKEDGSGADVGELGEICFANEYTRGYRNLPERTAAAWRDGLFHTGDLGTIDRDGNITLHGRNDDMIKINGNRIEPMEIEAAAKEILGISRCVAKGFADKDRSYLCLYYTDEIALDENALTAALSARLPYYMVPSYYIHIDEFPLLPTGKLNRRGLPKPAVQDFREEYRAPENEIEQILCDAFAQALRLDRVGIHDDFYKLGGDSLASIVVVSNAGIESLTAADIFNGRTVRKIAAILAEKELSQTPAEELEADAEQRTHALLPFQTNMLDYQLYTPKSTMWNLTDLYRMDKDKVDAARLCDAVNRVINHYSVFGTVFAFDENTNLIQRYDQVKKKPVTVETMTEAEFELFRKTAVKPFTMLHEPLFDMHVIETETHVYFLNQAHHMVFDGMSLVRLGRSIVDAYHGRELAPDTYFACIEQMLAEQQTRRYREAKSYYQDTYAGKDWCTGLEPGREFRENTVQIVEQLQPVSQKQLQASEKRLKVTRSIISTAAVLLAITEVTGRRAVMCSTIYHNRENLMRQNVIGLLIRSIPVGITIDMAENAGALLAEVKRKFADGTVNSCYEWEFEQGNVFLHDLFTFVYEGSILDIGPLSELGAVREFASGNHAAACRNTAMYMMETPDGIMTRMAYREHAVERETAERFLEAFSRIFTELVQNNASEIIPVTEL
ncbi:MAG: AMP-binding protein, partial [Eubacteriales bacterium]|nr:AMP-binding protein [Eubacteriales bacterium]